MSPAVTGEGLIVLLAGAAAPAGVERARPGHHHLPPAAAAVAGDGCLVGGVGEVLGLTGPALGGVVVGVARAADKARPAHTNCRIKHVQSV